MANNFTKVKKVSINSIADDLLYTVPSATTSIIIGFVISNKTNAEITFSASASGVQITGSNTPIPTASALSILDGKIVLQAGDTITARCNTANAADALISILEIV